ncbi:MAG: triose-phosphate isomerase [Opitutae bacterium]|nr:triose-phosphate isomerase [Opitutae bacterium]|tara:strand:+ start:2056 stop:2820 length:765 start_codon:yes stop_codon:yes gene_type:complete
MSRKYLIAGNWKMNKTATEAVDLIKEINSSVGSQTTVQVCVCPPFTSLAKASELVDQTEVILGAQNMSAHPSGAFTGEISAEMLRDLYVGFVILGHSERRQFYGETNESVNKKVLAAVDNNLKPIYCIGETLEEREAGQTLEIVRSQVREGLENFPANAIDNLVLAYEPVWAIGTGKTATDEMAQEVHADIRKVLVEMFGDSAGASVRILYGGSMKPENAAGLLSQPDVDGGLIGGASLTSRAFSGIVEAALSA